MIEKLIETVLENYQRGPQFFINSNRYTQYSTQMTDREIKFGDLISVSLQCSGHGSFKKQAVATRFVNHLAEILRYNQKVKKIKLKISGFDLSEELSVNSKRQSRPTLIKSIVGLLEQKISFVSSLQIRVSNVTNCSEQDFKAILNLGVNQGAKQLTNLSCQFSDWTFKYVDKNNGVDDSIYAKGIKKTDHDRNGQPSLETFLNMLNEAFENTLGSPMQDLKKFRLQISTWYYSDFQMELFFYGTQNNKGIQSVPKSDKISQRIQYFHNEFKSRVQAMILNLMPNLTNMQLDLRNWNKMFEMGVLKSALMNISSRQRQNSLSQISKRQQKTKIIAKSIISMVLQQPVNDKKINQKIKEQFEEGDKQQYFDLSIVI